jgi:lysophospholipase L1-like esterase
VQVLRQLFMGLALLFSAQVARASSQVWVGTWAASQQIPEPQNALPSADLMDATLRQTVHVSLGGATIRVHLSNAFGTRSLHLNSVHIARPIKSGSSEIDSASDRTLLFSSSPDLIIPPGAEYVSDPIAYPLAALSDLTISMHIEAEPGQQTCHPGSRQTTFYARGNLTSATSLVSAKKVNHWYILSGVDVQASPGAYSIVALGDSITDGHAATTDGNDRWTDVLAERLQGNAATRAAGVLNQGIGGNHLLTDGLGPNALARFDRDVLAQTSVRYLIVLEGINDLGALARNENATQQDHDELVLRIIDAYQQIVVRARAHGIKVYGATIMPDSGSVYYHPNTASEHDREQVNAWIRDPGNFDAVIDFDRVMADPARPLQLLPAYDSGDHLHPGPPGYEVMGQAVPFSLFK